MIFITLKCSTAFNEQLVVQRMWHMVLRAINSLCSGLMEDVKAIFFEKSIKLYITGLLALKASVPNLTKMEWMTLSSIGV